MDSGIVKANTTQFRAVALRSKPGIPSATTTLSACVDASDNWARINDTGTAGYWTVPETGLYAINITLGSAWHPIAPDGTEDYEIRMTHDYNGGSPVNFDLEDVVPDLTTTADTRKFRSIPMAFSKSEMLHFWVYGGAADSAIDVTIEIQKMITGPITSGTAYYYLKALTGTNTGKWWLEVDDTWQATETGNPATHQADGKWACQISDTAWNDIVQYLEYGKESNNYHDPDNGTMLLCNAGEVRPMFDWTYESVGLTVYLRMWLEVDGKRIAGGAGGPTLCVVSITDWAGDEIYNESSATFDAAGYCKIEWDDPVGAAILPTTAASYGATVAITYKGVAYYGDHSAKWQP